MGVCKNENEYEMSSCIKAPVYHIVNEAYNESMNLPLQQERNMKTRAGETSKDKREQKRDNEEREENEMSERMQV